MTKHNLSDPNLIAIDKRGKATLGRAIAGGASRALATARPFMLKDQLRNITVATDQGNKPISKNRQFKDWKGLWEDPYFAPYTLVISSSPSELMSHMVGMRLFLRANAMTKKDPEIKGRPLWHTIYGGIGEDKLRDRVKDTEINFLVLSNVPDNATPYKLEKLRDILSRYNHIPKVVVTSAACPIEFMSDTIRMPANFAIYLGAKKETRY